MEKIEKLKLRYPVILIPMIIFAITITFGIIYKEAFAAALKSAFEVLMVNYGWLISITMLIFIIFLLVILFHPIGKIRLGGPNAKPKMSYWQWFVISLCAGIGTGVVFWGAVEPLVFTFEPAPSLGLEPGSNAAVMWAMRTTFLHWTFTPYAIYVAFGVILAYVVYNMKKPFTVSAGFVPLLGDKALAPKTATFLDTLTVFAIVGGMAGSLGWGILQLGTGLRIIFGLEPNAIWYILMGVAIAAGYIATAVSGLRKGILWLGDKNATFYIILLLFLAICGPTAYFCNLFTQSTGSYFSHFLEAMTFTAPFPNSENWPQWWDMFWWTDWLSYGPIMGLFFVRLGYGRTMREFVVVNWVMPALFGLIWFTIFGGTVLHAQLFEGVDFYQIYKTFGMEALTLEAFNTVPFTAFVKPFMMLIVAVSFVTLANSMISTIASMSAEGSSAQKEANFGLKFAWGIIILLTSLLFTLTVYIEGLKMVKTFAGFPIVFVGLLMVFGFVTYMAKRPRDERNNFIYEADVANAPDSGEPPIPPSEFWTKVRNLITRLRKKS